MLPIVGYKFSFLEEGCVFGSQLSGMGKRHRTETRTIAQSESRGLTGSVEVLGRAGRGRSVAVAAVHGRVDGALAGGPVDHPVPKVLVTLETGRENVSTKRAFGPASR